jgi:Cdc6-like AAA superfamily ATPase
VPFQLTGLYTSEHFVGRDAELRAIESYLQPLQTKNLEKRKVMILQAHAGMGKTQLSLQYCRAYHHAYSGVFWIDCTTRESLLRSFVTLVRRIPRDEVREEAQSFVRLEKGDFDLVAKDILDWFSLPTNF